MYCSREYQLTSRFNQQYEKSTSNDWHVFVNSAWNVFGIKDWNVEILGGVLWLALCKIPSRMMPLENWKVSAFKLYRSVVTNILGVLTSMIDKDMGGRVTLPFVFIIE